MAMTETAVAAHRAASAAMITGVGTSTGSAASMYFSLSPAEWQVIGIIGGLLIGFVGLVVNASISVYFKRQHLLIERARAHFAEDGHETR